MNELDKEVFGFYKTTNKFIQKQKEKQMKYRNLDMSVIAYANGFKKFICACLFKWVYFMALQRKKHTDRRVIKRRIL